MRVAEAHWQGRHELVSTMLDKMMPKCFDTSAIAKAAMVKDARNRDGIAWRVDVLAQADKTHAYYGQWKLAMETQIVATEATQKAEEAINKLRSTTELFRGAIKNDLSSMKAASDRVQTEVTQMRDRYTAAQSLLTSPEFQMAVNNAERLATALESIHKLQGQRIGFALFSGEEKAS